MIIIEVSLQYFLWYLCLLPLILPFSKMSPLEWLSLGTLWFAGQVILNDHHSIPLITRVLFVYISRGCGYYQPITLSFKATTPSSSSGWPDCYSSPFMCTHSLESSNVIILYLTKMISFTEESKFCFLQYNFYTNDGAQSSVV